MKIINNARALSPSIRIGFLVLAAAAVLDLGYHALVAADVGTASHSGGVATAIHSLVLVGMVVTFAGLLRIAFRPQRADTRKEKQ